MSPYYASLNNRASCVFAGKAMVVIRPGMSMMVLTLTMQPRAAEFFAGIGLMRMGLDREGWSTVWANDMDEKKWEMYRANSCSCRMSQRF